MTFLPPAPAKPATFGIVHLENILKKEAQNGKSSLPENIQKNIGKPRLFHPKK